MVTCTISGACHHEVTLAWVNSFNNTYNKHKVRNIDRLKHSLGVITSNANIIPCGSLLILIFFKICQMGQICPVRGTYNHVSIFISQQQMHGDRCWHVQSAVHVTTNLIWLELTHSTKFLSSHRFRHGSLEVITSNANTIFCGSLLILSFF